MNAVMFSLEFCRLQSTKTEEKKKKSEEEKEQHSKAISIRRNIALELNC